MDLSVAEQIVMDRFQQKTRIAGGPKAGYVLRRAAVVYGQESDFDLDAALTGLMDRELLTSSEGGEWIYLTQSGAESLG